MTGTARLSVYSDCGGHRAPRNERGIMNENRKCPTCKSRNTDDPTFGHVGGVTNHDCYDCGTSWVRKGMRTVAVFRAVTPPWAGVSYGTGSLACSPAGEETL